MDITIEVIYARLQNIQANHTTDYGVLGARPRGIQVMHEYYDLSLSKIGIKDKYLPQRKAQRTRYLTHQISSSLTLFTQVGNISKKFHQDNTSTLRGAKVFQKFLNVTIIKRIYELLHIKCAWGNM